MSPKNGWTYAVGVFGTGVWHSTWLADFHAAGFTGSLRQTLRTIGSIASTISLASSTSYPSAEVEPPRRGFGGEEYL